MMNLTTEDRISIAEVSLLFVWANVTKGEPVPEDLIAQTVAQGPGGETVFPEEEDLFKSLKASTNVIVVGPYKCALCDEDHYGWAPSAPYVANVIRTMGDQLFEISGGKLSAGVTLQ